MLFKIQEIVPHVKRTKNPTENQTAGVTLGFEAPHWLFITVRKRLH